MWPICAPKRSIAASIDDHPADAQGNMSVLNDAAAADRRFFIIYSSAAATIPEQLVAVRHWTFRIDASGRSLLKLHRSATLGAAHVKGFGDEALAATTARDWLDSPAPASR